MTPPCEKRGAASSFPSTSAGMDRPSATTWPTEPAARASTSRSCERAPEEDVRFYIEADELRELFDWLVLPPPVRRVWAGRLRHP